MNKPQISGWDWTRSDVLHRVTTAKKKSADVTADDEVVSDDGTDAVIRRYTPVLPFNVIPDVILREGPLLKAIVFTLRYTDGRQVMMPVPAELLAYGDQKRAAFIGEQANVDVTPKQAAIIAEVVEAIVVGRADGIRTVEAITEAAWSGDDLMVPVEDTQPASPRGKFGELARYGKRAAVSEDEARKAWAEVVGIALGNPKQLIVLGIPFAGLYRALQSSELFAIHVTGDSNTGKTATTEAAMATVGDPRRGQSRSLYRTWDLSEKAPVALAKQLGILPLWLDESRTSREDSAGITQMLFSLASGRERYRATPTGGLEGGETWHCVVISTGEARLTTHGAELGLRKRVIEVYTPLASQQDTDRVNSLAVGAYGWPIKWLVEGVQDYPTPANILQMFRGWSSAVDIPEDMAAIFPSVAGTLTLCGAGFYKLAQLVGLPHESFVLDPIREAIRSVVAETVSHMAEESGISVAERLIRAVFNATRTRPADFRRSDEFTDGAIRRDGVRFPDGSIGIISDEVLARIARDADVPDYRVALRGCRERGWLINDKGKLQTRREVRGIDGKMERPRLYLFRPAPAPSGPAEGPSQ